MLEACRFYKRWHFVSSRPVASSTMIVNMIMTTIRNWAAVGVNRLRWGVGRSLRQCPSAEDPWPRPPLFPAGLATAVSAAVVLAVVDTASRNGMHEIHGNGGCYGASKSSSRHLYYPTSPSTLHRTISSHR